MIVGAGRGKITGLTRVSYLLIFAKASKSSNIVDIHTVWDPPVGTRRRNDLLNMKPSFESWNKTLSSDILFKIILLQVFELCWIKVCKILTSFIAIDSLIIRFLSGIINKVYHQLSVISYIFLIKISNNSLFSFVPLEEIISQR